MKSERLNDLFKKRLTDAYKLRVDKGISSERAIEAIVYLTREEHRAIARAFLQELAEGEDGRN